MLRIRSTIRLVSKGITITGTTCTTNGMNIRRRPPQPALMILSKRQQQYHHHHFNNNNNSYHSWIIRPTTNEIGRAHV